MNPRARLLVTAALAAALPACSSDATPETTRQALERLAPTRARIALEPAPAPALSAYRITFDRIDGASARDDAGQFLPKRAVRTVYRPFAGHVNGALRRRLGFEQDAPSSVERSVALRPLPDEARPDIYPPDTRRDARRARSVAGRLCRVYLYDDAEYCIDSAGLVLALRRGDTVEVAQRIEDLGAGPSAEAIAAELVTGVSDKARGSVRPVNPTTSPPGRTEWSLPAPPDGFTLVGRYTSVPLSREVLTEGSKAVVASLVDVYVRGVDTIVVDRGGKLDTTAVTDKELGALEDPSDVDLGALGAGRVGIGGIGPFGYREVRAFPEKGRFVVVAGTLPVDQIVELARALRPSPGTTLRYLDKL